jgi:sugar/nucleoside kinase (ribokinase family)
MADVCVVGGINRDLVAQVPHIPRPGETVQGGEGSNQAGAQPSLPRRTGVEELRLRGERS